MSAYHDLHDDCLDTLRREATRLTAREVAHLNYVAGTIAAGAALPLSDKETARAIVWSFHSQGPGRASPVLADALPAAIA